MEDLPPDLQGLFAEARRDTAEAERLARVAARLGPSLDAPAPPRWAWRLKAIVGGTLLAGALVASLSAVRHLGRASSLPSANPPASSSSTVEPSSPPPSSPPSSSSSVEPIAGEGEPRPSAPSPSSSSPAQAARSATPRPAATDLSEEHALLAEARRALGSSPAAALSLVEQHQRRFPRGMLSTEREYLRVVALSRLGRAADARAAAARFLASHRGSPYAAEVERLSGLGDRPGEGRP